MQTIPEKTETATVDIDEKNEKTEEGNPDSSNNDVNPLTLNFDNKKGTEVAMLLDIPKMDKRFTTY